jgi:hypothetical protein
VARGVEQPKSDLRRTSIVLRVRRSYEPLGTFEWRRCESGGELEERGCRGGPATRTRAGGGVFEVTCDLTIRPGCRAGTVPGMPIRVTVGIGGIGQGAMRQAPILRRGRSIDSGAHERVPEADVGVDPQRIGSGGSIEVLLADTQ